MPSDYSDGKKRGCYPFDVIAGFIRDESDSVRIYRNRMRSPNNRMTSDTVFCSDPGGSHLIDVSPAVYDVHIIRRIKRHAAEAP